MVKPKVAIIALVCFTAVFIILTTFRGHRFVDHFRVRTVELQEPTRTSYVTTTRVTSLLTNASRTTMMRTTTARVTISDGKSTRNNTVKPTTPPTVMPIVVPKPSPLTPLPLIRSAKAHAFLRTLKRPRNPFLVNGVWQSVRGPDKIYLYSAFYDDRAGVENAKVRIIAIAESSVLSDRGQYCLLWHSKSTAPTLVESSLLEISAHFSPNINGTRRGHRAVLFTCDVVDIPLNVSLVTWTTHEMRRPNTLLPVQLSPRQIDRIEFGHCLSVLYWKHDPYQLVEWIEMHRMWGVGEISIYTSSIGHQTKRVLDYYAKQGVVVVRAAPLAVNASADDEQAILLNMSPVLNDCMYRNMYRYRRLVCTDVDEFIVPRTHQNYSSLVTAIDALHEKQPRSYMFTNVYYFRELGVMEDEPSFLLTPRYLRHLKASPPGYSAKSITDPRACTSLQNHFCWHGTPATEQANWHVQVPMELGANQHYKPCHFDAYLNKPGTCVAMMNESFVDRRMLRFTDELKERTVPVLIELALIEETHQ